MKAYAVELNEAEIEFIKKEYKATTNAQIRNILQAWVETILAGGKVKEGEDERPNNH